MHLIQIMYNACYVWIIVFFCRIDIFLDAGSNSLAGEFCRLIAAIYLWNDDDFDVLWTDRHIVLLYFSFQILSNISKSCTSYNKLSVYCHYTCSAKLRSISPATKSVNKQSDLTQLFRSSNLNLLLSSCTSISIPPLLFVIVCLSYKGGIPSGSSTCWDLG